MKIQTIIFVFVAATASALPVHPDNRYSTDEQLQGQRAAEQMEVLIDSITQVQQYELANAMTFFPIGKDFFALFEDLRKIKVDANKAAILKEIVLTEVKEIQNLIYDHNLTISKYVNILAYMANDARTGDASLAESLLNDLTVIDEFTPNFINELFNIVVRMEDLAETFIAGVAVLLDDVQQKPSEVVVKRINDRALNIALAYVDKFEYFLGLLDRVQTDFENMLQETYAYIEVLPIKKV